MNEDRIHLIGMYGRDWTCRDRVYELLDRIGARTIILETNASEAAYATTRLADFDETMRIARVPSARRQRVIETSLARLLGPEQSFAHSYATDHEISLVHAIAGRSRDERLHDFERQCCEGMIGGGMGAKAVERWSQKLVRAIECKSTQDKLTHWQRMERYERRISTELSLAARYLCGRAPAPEPLATLIRAHSEHTPPLAVLLAVDHLHDSLLRLTLYSRLKDLLPKRILLV